MIPQIAQYYGPSAYYGIHKDEYGRIFFMVSMDDRKTWNAAVSVPISALTGLIHTALQSSTSLVTNKIDVQKKQRNLAISDIRERAAEAREDGLLTESEADAIYDADVLGRFR